MSDGDLADEHRGQTFALERAKGRLKDIEAELERRGVTEARGKSGCVTRRINEGLLDLKRVRAELGADAQRFAIPGSEIFFRSRTLTAHERGVG